MTPQPTKEEEYETCLRKTKYNKLNQAKRASKKYKQFIYKCGFHYHLTSNNPNHGKGRETKDTCPE